MIAIRLVSQAGAAPVAPLEAVFGDAGGDIGRAGDCTLVLPDPERRISRKHVQVAWRDGRHFLRLISTNLMVELDGVALVPGAEFALEPGAQIRIGPFVLKASGKTVPAARPAVAAPLLPVAARVDVAFDAPDDSMVLFAAPAQAGRASVFHDLLHPAAGVGAPPRTASPSALQEVDVLLGDATGSGLRPNPPAAPLAADADRQRALQGGDADELVHALFTGLGMAAPAPSARSAEQMELIGALLRSSISGALGLLAARGIAKRELGASPTLVQTRQNNPLKFSADVDTALRRMLEPPQRGFIPALPAVRETFDDLRAHEVAILAGMRAALEATLQRFEPATLEKRWAEKGVWENLRPVNHKAKLWDRFSEQHAEIVQEIEDDFDSIFSGAFSAAYDAQLARLTRSS